MKIVLFLNKDIEANIAFNLLKPELLNHTVRIYYSDTVGNPNNKPSDLIKLEYYEKGFLFNELATFIDEHSIKNTFEFFDDNFKSFPIEKCANVNAIEFTNKLKDFNPDLFISIRFGKIFKNEIIQIPKNGLINLHSAILPDYRGIMGTLHAIKEKNNKIGCTLHTIPNSGIDTGEIIEIAEFDVNRERSLFWNIVQLYPLGVELIIKNLKKIESHNFFIAQKQNLKVGNYFSVPTANDFEQIKSLGMEIVSPKDYQDVLTYFILKNLSEIEKHHLTLAIDNTDFRI
jgi:methionyl-tRNA formyltransferase